MVDLDVLVLPILRGRSKRASQTTVIIGEKVGLKESIDANAQVVIQRSREGLRRGGDKAFH